MEDRRFEGGRQKMSDEFKKQLEAYENGELFGKELEEFEAELGKLEQYQQLLSETDEEDYSKQPVISDEKQRKLMKRGKWKARIQTVFFAFGVFIIFTVVTSVLTAVYYQWGNPDRNDVYRAIIEHTLTITDPYGEAGGTSMNSGPYFTMKATKDMKKQVGKERIKVGEMNVKFFFSLMSHPEKDYYGRLSENRPIFFSPELSEDDELSDWDRLEQLPEGTVVSAFISLAELMETTEVLHLLDDKDIDLLWLAVETGEEWKHDEYASLDPIGFPSYPIWHDDDMTLTSREEKKGFLFGKIVSEGHESPEYEEGDARPLQEQFIKTLEFLQQHERKANKFYFGKLNLAKRLDYLGRSGFQHYGIVITGPTKEVLTLKDEPWVNRLEIDEVELWNWYSYE